MKVPILFLFLSISFISAQGTLSGTLVSENSEKPIAFAHIYLKGTSLGTTTNSDGAFSIFIPSEHNKGTVVFSSMGYESFEVHVPSIVVNKNLSIKLVQSIEYLDEVVVHSDRSLSALEIVKKAFETNSSDTSKYPYYAKGFIRHIEKADNEYKWLVEAAIELYDEMPKENVKVNILETRKSFDSRNIDTIQVVLGYLIDVDKTSYRKKYDRAIDYKNSLTYLEVEKAINYYDNHFTNGYNKRLGLLEKIFSSNDILRNYNKKKSLFSEKNTKDFKFEKDSIFYQNDNLIYKIKFSRYNKKQKELDAGWMYIRGSDYKILQIDYSLVLGMGHHYRIATGNKIRYSLEIKYLDYNNSLYPHFISLKTYKSAGFNRKNRMINTIFTHQEILFNEIISDKHLLKKQSKKFENRDSNLFSKRAYNPQFWKNFNLLLDNKEQTEFFSELKQLRINEKFIEQ